MGRGAIVADAQTGARGARHRSDVPRQPPTEGLTRCHGIATSVRAPLWGAASRAMAGVRSRRSMATRGASCESVRGMSSILPPSLARRHPPIRTGDETVSRLFDGVDDLMT